MSGEGLSVTTGLLEEVRDRIDANRVTAEFATGHGTVEIVVEADGWRILVDGELVPRAVAQ